MKNITNTQIEIMKVFVGNINKKFSIKEIAGRLSKPYALVYNSTQKLIQERFLLTDDRKLISLNFRENPAQLSFFESVRTEVFLEKNKDFSLFWKDCLKTIKSDFFITLLFGSSVYKFGRDIDLLFVFPKGELETNEMIIRNLSKNFTLNLDLNFVSFESVYEMLSKREEANVLNELMNNHLILFGGENFYRILKNARR